MLDIKYLTDFHTIVNFDDVIDATAVIFKPEVFKMNYENICTLQTMCIQRYGYEGRKRAVRSAYAYGLLRGLMAVKTGMMQNEPDINLRLNTKSPNKTSNDYSRNGFLDDLFTGW